MKFLFNSLSLLTLAAFLTACGKSEKTATVKKVSLTKEPLEISLGEAGESIKVMNTSALASLYHRQIMLKSNSPQALETLMSQPGAISKQLAQEPVPQVQRENTLLMGVPLDFFDEQLVFGAVITKVSDSENERLGTLKLTDLSPIHAKAYLGGLGTENPGMFLVGCIQKCSETADQAPFLKFPILGVNPEAEIAVVDLTALGDELNLIDMLDPKGDYTGLEKKSSQTTAFEYSNSTIVFDVESIFTEKKKTTTQEGEALPSKEVKFTVRWYFKMGSFFNPSFVPREPKKEVGFFTTGRGSETKISRFTTTDYGIKPVRYLIKDVPDKYKPSFKKAMDSWNVTFKKVIGREMISYTFVDQKDDPSVKDIVAGDIRYNVIEWDLLNRASYGGLGPSIANQMTGEILSANVLVQGPHIIKLYTKWFEDSNRMKELIEQGEVTKAQEIMAKFNAAISNSKPRPITVKVGSLEFNNHAFAQHYADPIDKLHFEMIPEGVTFDEYMDGYFQEIVAHEVGHNLGLRHNFKGNLGANESGQRGSSSRSIMEYLARPFRYLATISEYDEMAIAYGYAGVEPEEGSWFCTDQDAVNATSDFSKISAECNKNDATNDPFSYFTKRLSRGFALAVDIETENKPVWKAEKLLNEIQESVTGILAYAASAEATADSWTNFFGKLDRPQTKEEVKDYVLNKLLQVVCDPTFKEAIASKIDTSSQEEAQANYDILFEFVKERAVIAQKSDDEKTITDILAEIFGIPVGFTTQIYPETSFTCEQIAE